MITEFERDLRKSFIQPPAQSRLSSEVRQVTQDFAKLSLEDHQGWMRTFSGQHFFPLDCLHNEKAFPYVQYDLLLFQLMPTLSCPPTLHDCEELGSVPLINFLIGKGGLLLDLLKLSLLQAEQAQFPQPMIIYL